MGAARAIQGEGEAMTHADFLMLSRLLLLIWLTLMFILATVVDIKRQRKGRPR
jgi:hypothetical protein